MYARISTLFVDAHWHIFSSFCNVFTSLCSSSRIVIIHIFYLHIWKPDTVSSKGGAILFFVFGFKPIPPRTINSLFLNFLLISEQFYQTSMIVFNSIDVFISIFYIKPRSRPIGFYWAINAHAASPQPTAWWSPTYSLMTITGSNQS